VYARRVPRRTNLFQQVVAIVYHQLSDDPPAESAMVPDATAGTDREVDVLIKAEVAGEEITVAVEATALGRKLDLPGVQALIKKHEKLGTSQLIIVSESGFTEPADREIKATPIVSGYQPTDLKNPQLLETKIVGKLAKLWRKRFSVTVTEVFAELELPASLLKTNIVPWTRLPLHFPLDDAKANEVATPEMVVLQWANANPEAVGELLDVANTAVDTDKTFLTDLCPPWRVDGRESDLYLMVDTNINPNHEPTPEPLRLLKLDLCGSASIRVSEADLRHQQLSDKIAYSVGHIVEDGESLLLVASATSKGETVTTLSLGPKQPAGKQPARRRRSKKLR
jgi:Restriction endonuclease